MPPPWPTSIGHDFNMSHLGELMMETIPTTDMFRTRCFLSAYPRYIVVFVIVKQFRMARMLRIYFADERGKNASPRI